MHVCVRMCVHVYFCACVCVCVCICVCVNRGGGTEISEGEERNARFSENYNKKIKFKKVSEIQTKAVGV